MKLQAQGMARSMSRIGYCIDNGSTEGFRGLVKAEMFCPNKFEDEATLRTVIEKDVHFYNGERHQKRFGNRTPMEVRIAALNANPPAQYPNPGKQTDSAIQSNACRLKQESLPPFGNSDLDSFFVVLPVFLTRGGLYAAALL
ncbi:MAG: IS3 family transposase [Clostridia bacterium]